MATKKDDIFKELTERFIDSSIERLDGLDDIINNIYQNHGNRGEYYSKFIQEVHSLKGSAGTFGFHTVSTISHRLEDYMESSRRLKKEQWLEVQKFVDIIRDIFENGIEPDEKTQQKLVSNLPSSSAAKQKGEKTKTLILVMPSGVLRKHLGVELAAKSFDVSFASDPISALNLALKLKPHAVISSQEFAYLSGMELAKIFTVLEATNKIKFILMTASKKLEQESKDMENLKIVYKDKNAANHIADYLNKQSK